VEFLEREVRALHAWLRRTISVTCGFLALFLRLLAFVFNELPPLFGKSGGCPVAEFRLTKLVEITTRFACGCFR
jgi:hypothetical protein